MVETRLSHTSKMFGKGQGTVEVHVSAKDQADYSNLSKEGAPVNISPLVIIGNGTSVLLNEPIDNASIFLRTPNEEIEKLRREIAELDDDIQKACSAKMKHQALNDRYQEDASILEYYQEIMEMFVTQMKRIKKEKG